MTEGVGRFLAISEDQSPISVNVEKHSAEWSDLQVSYAAKCYLLELQSCEPLI